MENNNKKKQINCNLSNDIFNDEEWERIQMTCRKKKHIGKNDSLRELIKTDEQKLSNNGITFEQLNNFFEKIKYHFLRKISSRNTIFRSTEEEDKIFEKYDLGQCGWSCWGIKAARIFQNKLLAIRITWGGAESCPFQSVHDTRYHGYEYGSHDWIFIKKQNGKCVDSMHISDLLFHQIVCHHFFQSPSSPYHVDIEKLVNFFNLRSNIDYANDLVYENVWRLGGGGWTRPERNELKKIFVAKKEDLKELNKQYFVHLEFGINDIYHDKECLIVYTNDGSSIPSELYINGARLRFNNESCDIGIQKYYIGKNKYITEAEEKKEWM